MEGTMYLTNEQIHRLAGLACDALVGIQFSSDADSTTEVTGCFVRVDEPSAQHFFTIDADGTYTNET